MNQDFFLKYAYKIKSLSALKKELKKNKEKKKNTMSWTL